MAFHWAYFSALGMRIYYALLTEMVPYARLTPISGVARSQLEASNILGNVVKRDVQKRFNHPRFLGAIEMYL